MEFLDQASIGFLVVYLATLLIFGELMVRTKGLFGLLGIAIMAMYFSYHLTSTDVGFWVVLLYLIGLSLVIFDGKVTGDGTIAFIGILLMVLGLALPAPDIVYSVLVGLAFIVAAPSSYLFTKVFRTRKMWEKMTLKDKLSSENGYNSMNDDYHELVGKMGVTKTSFRPTGTVEIDGKLYSATSDNLWINEEVSVKITSVDGTRIVIVPE